MNDKIRNFSIIAHIDHGKSTLADRILDLTNAVTEREKKEQLLDNMEVERERGITVKSRSVTLSYKSKSGEIYQINLIDTPGHVDFHYEVSRSLAACEGALLVVDATQGVQAQTVAHVYTAISNNVEIIPVFNKVDLTTADPEGCREQVRDIIGLETDGSLNVSGKTGEGVEELLETLIERVPAPKVELEKPLKALIFDSWFDTYLGVMMQVRIFEGELKKRMKIKLMQKGGEFEVTDVGIYTPALVKVDSLKAGEVGFIGAAIKDIGEVVIGDTITETGRPTETPLEGFEEVKPMVFSGMYPTDSAQYQILREALEKLQLNDAAFSFEPETSAALGFGFRCGYLGLLHMEIIGERLDKEFAIDLIATAPTVVYKIKLKNEEVIDVDNPAFFPELGEIESISEPFILGTIHTPKEFLGNILSLCEQKRGVQKSLDFHGGNRVCVNYYLPLNEVVIDFYDRLKASSKGYASFDYEFSDYRIGDMVKIDIKINGEVVDALSAIIHRSKSYYFGRKLTEKMKEFIDRQMFEVAIQAAIGGRVIARSTVKAMRKNVTAKCYGGDITRKRKLLEKQKAGKKRMKQVGSVEISQDAFLAVLKLDD